MNYKFVSVMASNHIRKLSYGKIKSWYCGLVQRPPPIPPYDHIIQIGDPVLREVAEPIPINQIQATEIKYLVKQLRSTMKQYGCVGLNATQVGIPLRIMIVEFSSNHLNEYTKEEIKNKEIETLPQTVIINPELRVIDFRKIIHSEGCESIKGYCADVPRFREVEIKGFNENGDCISLNTKGWLARIFQHEIDHLNGKLYTDIMDCKTLTCTCWQVVNERRGKVELPFSP